MTISRIFCFNFQRGILLEGFSRNSSPDNSTVVEDCSVDDMVTRLFAFGVHCEVTISEFVEGADGDY